MTKRAYMLSHLQMGRLAMYTNHIASNGGRASPFSSTIAIAKGHYLVFKIPCRGRFLQALEMVNAPL